jgi:hypothetical protein
MSSFTLKKICYKESGVINSLSLKLSGCEGAMFSLLKKILVICVVSAWRLAVLAEVFVVFLSPSRQILGQ